MSSIDATDLRPAFADPLAPFLDHPDLPLHGTLTTADVQTAFANHHVHFGRAHNSIFTPALTLWAWLSQALFPDKSTAAACLRVSVLLLALTRRTWSEDTGTLCRARARLPAAPLQALAETLADRLEAAAPAHWLWRGHHVYLGDGTTLSLPDTPENQAAFPQPDSQKKGLGFPLIRVVALLSLATGLVRGLAYGAYQGKGTAETALLRQLLGRLTPGCVVVLDRYYGHYWMIALLRAADVHVCVRLHGNKRCDFRKGKRLGHLDHIVTWKRPARPKGMSEEEYQQFPKELTLREVGIDLPQRGGSGGRVVVVTDLVDAGAYPKEDIAELYKWRWQVEVDLRHLKVTLQMRELVCQTPARVAAELWTHILGYNLVRKVMAQAALYQAPSKRPSRARRGAEKEQAVSPRQLRFKAAVQVIQTNWQTLSAAAPEQYRETAQQLLKSLAGKRLRQRPGRHEPRALKRRPRNRAVLTKPRAEVKKRLAQGKQGKASGVNPRRRH